MQSEYSALVLGHHEFQMKMQTKTPILTKHDFSLTPLFLLMMSAVSR